MDYLINDEIKYFLYNNKFLHGTVTEILPNGSTIVKNNHTKLCHKVSTDNVVPANTEVKNPLWGLL